MRLEASDEVYEHNFKGTKMSFNEDIKFRNQYEQKEGIIFCVGLTETMFKADGMLGGKAPLKEILESIDSIMANLAISLPHTGVGCYFFNSKKTSANCESNMFQYFRLQQLNTKIMKLVKDTLKDLDDAKEKVEERLVDFFPMVESRTKEEFEKNRTPLNKVFVQLKKEFIFNVTNSKQYNYKRVFLITHDDKPFDASSNEGQDMKKTIRLLSGDLDNAKVNFTPLFLNSGSHRFDTSLFSEILYLDNDDRVVEDDGFLNLGKTCNAISITDLRKKINSRKEVHRMLYQCPLEIGPGLLISVKGFSMYSDMSPKVASTVYRKSETVSTVFNKTKYFAAKSSRYITDPKDELVHAYRFGDDALHLTQEQMQAINNFEDEDGNGASRLKIVGFKKLNKAIKHQNLMSKSDFIYVNTKGAYINSFRAFSCLYQSCRDLDSAAIVWGSKRMNSFPSLYAMVPSHNQTFDFGPSLKFPQGFFLIKLPSYDALRSFPSQIEAVEVPTELTIVAKQLLKSFDLAKGYIPSEYKNPTLQWHYQILRKNVLLEETTGAENTAIQNMNDQQLQEYCRFDDTSVKVANINKLIQAAKQLVEASEVKSEPSIEFLKQTKRVHLIRALNSQLNILSGEKELSSGQKIRK